MEIGCSTSLQHEQTDSDWLHSQEKKAMRVISEYIFYGCKETLTGDKWIHLSKDLDLD